MSTTLYSETDAVTDWMLIVCAGVLSRSLSSWVMVVRTVGHSAKYLFTSEQNVVNIILR